ncbi:MAG: TonB-dependent receptor, partial [Gemmatimonadales bacterium]
MSMAALAAQDVAPPGRPASPAAVEVPASLAAESRSVPLSRTPARVRVFDAEDLERSGARTLGEFLSHELPADARSRGGPGLSSQSLQGAARPQDTVSLLDGVRLSDPTRGAPDLNASPLLGITRVEVLSGPMEARTGGGATGGVVALYTGAPRKDGSAGTLAGAGGNRGGALGEALPGFSWSEGWFKAGIVSAREDQATETARPYRLDVAYVGLSQKAGRATW